MIDHDRLFKELLTTFFAEFIELFLPAVAEYFDRERFEFLDKEVFTDVTAGDRHEADLVVKARFRGRETCFLVHLENQATAEAEFGKRMFRYFARLHERYDLPVYPIALLTFDAPRRPEPDRYTVEFPDRTVRGNSIKPDELAGLHSTAKPGCGGTDGEDEYRTGGPSQSKTGMFATAGDFAPRCS